MHARVKPTGMGLLAGLWVIGIVIGFSVLLDYANAPGSVGEPPRRWPVGSALRRSSDRATLLLFMHPRCPCTRATLGELASIVRHCQDRVSVLVLSVRPSDADPSWEKTGLWNQAAAIPGVEVQSDLDGREARRFGAQTSGAAMLYSAPGELLFQGGITSARGHAGDNAGRSAIVALLRNQTPEQRQTFVFGCELFNPSCGNDTGSQDEGACCHH